MRTSFPDVSLLIVDDNYGMRAILAAVLRALGFSNIQMATNAGDAWKILPEARPDLIITDLKMPGGDGIDLARRLRFDETSPFTETPIIIVTGHTDMRYVRACLDAGVNQFLAKPVTGASVANRIQRVMSDDRPFVRTADYVGPCRLQRAA